MRRRRWLLILGGLCLAVFLLLAGAWVLSRTQWAQDELRQGLAHLISRELELPVRLNDFTLSFRLNTFEIRQLEILDPQSLAPLLTIDRLRVALEWTSLLRRVTKVESVTVANPILTVNDSPKFRETINRLLSRLQAMAKERPATRFPVEVTGGAVRYVNDAEGLAAQGDKIEIALGWRDAEHAQVALRVGTAQVKRGELALTDLAATGQLEITKEKSVIEELELRHKQATARLQGSVTHQPIAFALTGKTELDLEELSTLLKAPRPFAGILAVSGSVSGGETPLTLTGTASLPETGLMWGVPLKRFTGRFTYQANRIEVETLYAEGFGGSVSGHGVLSLPNYGYTADLRFQSLRLAELIKQSGRSVDADGWLTGQAKLSGEGTNGTALMVESTFTADQLQLMGHRRAAHASFRGRLAKGVVQVAELTLTRGHSRATAKGRVELATHALALDVRTQVENLAEDLWPTSANGGLAGRLTLVGTVTRKWDDPLFTGQIRAERLSIKQRSVDLVEGPLSVSREGLASQRLRLKIGESGGELSGRAKFTASSNGSHAWVERLRPSIKLTVRGRAEDLLSLIPLKAPVKGQLVLNLQAEGPVEALEGSGSLTLSGLDLYGDRIQNVRARFTLRGDTLLVPEIVVLRQGLTLRGEGELNRSGAYRFASQPLPFDLASLPKLRDYQTRGRIVLSARGAGQLGTPQIDGQMTVTGLRVGDHSLGDGSGRFALAGAHWEWELAFASGYQARGRLPLRLAGPFQAELQAESADVSHWLRGVDLRHPLTAKATGRARLEGDLGEPASVRATVEVSSATGQLGPAEWRTSRPARLEIQQGKVQIREVEVTGPLFDLALSGEVVPHQMIALQIRAVAPYALVAPWLPIVGDYRGRPAIELSLNGAPRTLTVSGRARLDQMEIKLNPLPFWVRVEQGAVNFKNDAVEFQVQQGAVHGGRLESTGTVVRTGDRWRHSINFKLDFAEFGAMLASLNPGSRWAEGNLFTSGVVSFETGGEVDPFQTLNGRAALRAEGGTLSRYPGLVKAFGVVGPAEDARLPDLTQERMPYRQILADFTITKGLMQTKNLLLDSPTVRMSGVGDVNLPERQVDFRLAIQPLERLEGGMRRIPVLKRLFPREQKLLVVYLNANGPLVEPHVTVAPIKTLSQNIVDLLLFLIRAPDRLLIPGDAR